MESDLREDDGLQTRVTGRKSPLNKQEENSEAHQTQGDCEIRSMKKR